MLGLSNRTLYTVKGRHEPGAAASVTLARERLLAIIGGEMSLEQAIRSGDVKLDGDEAALRTVFGNLDTFQSGFAIVEP